MTLSHQITGGDSDDGAVIGSGDEGKGAELSEEERNDRYAEQLREALEHEAKEYIDHFTYVINHRHQKGKSYGEDVETVNKKVLRLNWTPATIRHLWEPICKNGVKYDSETVHLKLLRLLFRYVIRPASSAGSERTYSILEASATKLRANLTPKTLTNLLCLACKEE